jgi:hypothetical protein
MAKSVHHQGKLAAITQMVEFRAGLVLLAALATGPALAQQHAKPQVAAPALAPAAADTTAQPVSARKRSAFGQAMSQLTQALRDASQQAQATSAQPAATSASTAAAANPAPVASDHAALAVESPP